ncbi:lyase family protein [uncultured Roseobacter sp.]|uniref:lyase family protein n=1 Tax=uncultured Roseobacter sp. TaxID=114847 RepID=UPI002612B96A|nr:lyase family protein [uncultured Roseobacter sp.]
MLDSRIYRDCFSSSEMRDIWSEHATISTWLKAEQVLARCQADLGVIPNDAATAMEAISVSELDVEDLAAEMALVGRPIIGLVKQLRVLVPTHANHVHFNSTTQDIMDTAMVIQMKLGLEGIRSSTIRVTGLLDAHIAAHSSTVLIGRTNGQHALPIALSAKLRVWRSELLRRLEAMEFAASRGLNVQVGGPVGDLRGYESGMGESVKSAMAEKLSLGMVDPHWQSARDGVAEILATLGLLCGSLCKIGHNINLMSSSDIAEVSEGHVNGKGASSSMHHKRNQRASEFLEAVARLGRQRAEQIGEFTLHQHERSGGAWIGEWTLVPEVFLLTSGAVSWAETLLSDVTFHAERMGDRAEAVTASNRENATQLDASGS